MNKLFIAPHNDDETLFGSFTIQRERPPVLVVFDSFVQVARGHVNCDWWTRRMETAEALLKLTAGPNCSSVPKLFAGLHDDLKYPAHVVAGVLLGIVGVDKPVETVWAPAFEDGGHEQHNLVAEAVGLAFPSAKIIRYLTYTRTRTHGKSTSANVVPATGVMVRRKLEALACYRTQIENEALGCWPHFLRDQTEYYAE